MTGAPDAPCGRARRAAAHGAHVYSRHAAATRCSGATDSTRATTAETTACLRGGSTYAHDCGLIVVMNRAPRAGDSDEPRPSERPTTEPPA